ncbi:MAG: terminase small subunit [Clostridia bacterium]|nr:terminase small subunit [Clostridia bacterium]
MTDKQRRFCDEYLIDCNATQAAIRAGYSEKTARFIGNENLTKPYIKNYIDDRLSEINSAKTADAKEVMEYLTSVMRGESSAEIVVVEGEGEGYSSARKVQKAPDEKERLKAAELLGKRFGLFTDKVNVEGTAKVVIVDDLDE